MHAHDTTGVPRGRGDRGHGKRGGVGREQGVRWRRSVDLGEDLLLGAQVLAHRLDHHLGLEHGGREVGLRAQAARGRIAILLGELAASHRDRQQVVQSPHGEPQRVRLAVGEADVEAGERGGVGDPVPHGTRADHRDATGGHPVNACTARRPTSGTLVHNPSTWSARSRRMSSGSFTVQA